MNNWGRIFKFFVIGASPRANICRAVGAFCASLFLSLGLAPEAKIYCAFSASEGASHLSLTPSATHHS